MRGVVYEHQADRALVTARVFWPRVDDAIELLEWALIRDPSAGLPIFDGSPIRVVIFEGAKSVGFPTIQCTFEVTKERLVFHDLEFCK